MIGNDVHLNEKKADAGEVFSISKSCYHIKLMYQKKYNSGILKHIIVMGDIQAYER